MAAFPPHVDADDMPHVGIMFRRIREARGFSQSDIARALGVTSSTISKFEGTGRSRRRRIVERYIQTLHDLCREGMHSPYPLDDDAANLLIGLSGDARGDNRHTRAVQISAYDLALALSPNCPAELKTLLQRLRQTRWPALICDGLWFVHAVNGAFLNLFGLDEGSALLRRWESWHLIGAELVDPSPVSPVHVWLDGYVPPLVWEFFRTAAPYLFTPQMRALLRKLHILSARNGRHFREWWYSATALTLFYCEHQSVRLVRRNKHVLLASVLKFEPHIVPSGAKTDLPYYLGEFEPIGIETQTAFEQLSGPARRGDVLYAADFDLGRAFHVNCWPEVARAVLDGEGFSARD